MEIGSKIKEALMTFYLILPVVTFVISILIGKDESWGRYRWCMFKETKAKENAP